MSKLQGALYERPLFDFEAKPRAWVYVYNATELSLEEHNHILRCAHCLYVFTLCLKSENFGALLKALGTASDK
jgi:hypothetical protein